MRASSEKQSDAAVDFELAATLRTLVPQRKRACWLCFRRIELNHFGLVAPDSQNEYNMSKCLPSRSIVMFENIDHQIINLQLF